MPSELDVKCSCIYGLSGCQPFVPDLVYPNTDFEKWLAISYTVCIVSLVLMAGYAIWRTRVYLQKKHRDQTAEEFCTARGTMGMMRIAYSFFAGAVGAWCISAPSSFAVYSGILGLAMYAFASGLPVLVLALCGARIVRKHENVLSVGDFAGRRFGPVFKTIVVLICLFNMSIAMLAEYTTIGSLFADFVGSIAWPMIMTVGILTMAYTMYGGLYISILTDRVQAILTITLIAVLTIYVAVTFRAPLVKPLPNDTLFGYPYYSDLTINWPLGVNKFGYSAIFSMPVALMAATVFSEAVWQKVWASQDRRALIGGGTIGFILITLAVFIFGLGGWLAAWAGYVTFGTNSNLYLFQVFRDEIDAGDPGLYSARVQSWVGIITLMLAVTMNEAAIDSLQNGLTSCISTQWFKKQHIVFTRIIVVCINVPILVIATRKYTILQLFLIANMLTTCWFLPVLAGLWDCTTNFVGETGAVFGGSVAILTTIAYASGRIWYKASSGGEAIQCGAWYAWWGDYNYDWDQFLVASGSSVVAMALWGSIAWALRRFANVHGPGITGCLNRIPGFAFVTGETMDCDFMTAIGLGRFNPPPRIQEAEAENPLSEIPEAVKPTKDANNGGDSSPVSGGSGSGGKDDQAPAVGVPTATHA